MKKQNNNNYYTVTYRDPKDGKTVHLKANTIKDSNLGLSFIFISDFILKGEGSSKIIDPNEEKLRNQLKDTKGILARAKVYCQVYCLVNRVTPTV